MNLLSNTTKSPNSVNNERIFKYIGLAPKGIIRACPNCGGKGPDIYEYLNVKTRQVVHSCWSCIEDRTIKTKPQITAIYLGQKQPAETRLETLKGEKAQSYPVKDYLLSRSYLVKYNEKEASGKKLTKAEERKAQVIYEKRDIAMYKIRKEFEKYYNTANYGNYRFDGMPEIEKGICG